MFFYWRVQQDLNCLGETIRFYDPRLLRCQQEWRRRNSAGIALAEQTDLHVWLHPSLN